MSLDECKVKHTLLAIVAQLSSSAASKFASEAQINPLEFIASMVAFLPSW